MVVFMKVKNNAKDRQVVDADIPRSLGNKKLSEKDKKLVLDNLRTILYELDSYIQGANLFIVDKLLERKTLALDKDEIGELVAAGNKYVRDMENYLATGQKYLNRYIPLASEDEDEKTYLDKIHPGLRATLEHKILPYLHKAAGQNEKPNMERLTTLLRTWLHQLALFANRAAGWFPE